MIRCVLIAAMMLGWCGSSFAGLVTDDFDRADTSWGYSNAVPTTIGADWLVLKAATEESGRVRISNNMLDAGTGFSPAMVLVNTAAQTVSGDGYSFTFSAIGQQDNNANAHPEFVWNAQDGENYYFARLIVSAGATFQFWKTVGGASSFVSSLSLGFLVWENGNQYEVTISTDTPHTFAVQVRDLAHDVTTSGTFADEDENFNGGYAGFRIPAGALFYDDFRLEMIPEPEVLLLFGGKPEIEP